jgi:YidC/Oxa1 family membrane protein insertase
MDLFELLMWAWDNLLVIPMINVLVLFSWVTLGSFGLAIILFTLVMRVITWPVTRQQLHATRAMQAAQPRISEIQKKYKDPRRRSEETMKIYREVGFSPLGCVWPMLIQMPIWFALYQSIRITLGSTPESLLELSQTLYPFDILGTAVPLENQFLWMDMAQPDETFIMAILVGGSTWVQQRMTTPRAAATDPQQQQVNNTMMFMMPLMFAFLTLQFPSGLALYWVVTNVFSIVLQYIYMGPGEFDWRRIISISPPVPQPAVTQPARVGGNGDAGDAGDAEEGSGAAVTEDAGEETGKRRRRRRRGRRRR